MVKILFTGGISLASKFNRSMASSVKHNDITMDNLFGSEQSLQVRFQFINLYTVSVTSLCTSCFVFPFANPANKLCFSAHIGSALRHNFSLFSLTGSYGW